VRATNVAFLLGERVPAPNHAQVTGLLEPKLGGTILCSANIINGAIFLDVAPGIPYVK
jgi:hypothetical protein